MATKHGTQTRYVNGCRCEECIEAHRLYQRDYRQRKANGEVAPRVVVLPTSDVPQDAGPGPVELGVEAEISGLAADARPGLAQAALALARVMDNPKAINQKPSAAKVLGSLLDKLRSAAAQNRRGGLALVRTMVEKGNESG